MPKSSMAMRRPALRSSRSLRLVPLRSWSRPVSVISISRPYPSRAQPVLAFFTLHARAPSRTWSAETFTATRTGPRPSRCQRRQSSAALRVACIRQPPAIPVRRFENGQEACAGATMPSFGSCQRSGASTPSMLAVGANSPAAGSREGTVLHRAPCASDARCKSRSAARCASRSDSAGILLAGLLHLFERTFRSLYEHCCHLRRRPRNMRCHS